MGIGVHCGVRDPTTKRSPFLGFEKQGSTRTEIIARALRNAAHGSLHPRVASSWQTHPSILFGVTSLVCDAWQVCARRAYRQSRFGVKMLDQAVSAYSKLYRVCYPHLLPV